MITLQDHDYACEYWRCAAGWHDALKAKEDSKRCRVRSAETLILKAKTFLAAEPPRNGDAAHWLKCGYEALVREEGKSARSAEILRQLGDVQKAALAELKPLEFNPFDHADFKEFASAAALDAQEHGKGHSFQDAVSRFVHVTEPTNVAELHRHAKETSDLVIWDKLFGSTKLDWSGKVVDHIPASNFGEPDSEMTARKKLVANAREVHWPLKVQCYIEPARKAIFDEHPLLLKDLTFLVENNPFVPSGAEHIYLRGFHFGFWGNWLAAMHLLIPQLEASLRALLRIEGISDYKIHEGFQMHLFLDDLVRHPKIVEILGENVLFDLRGILVERFGFNFRNEVAHGLAPAHAFYNYHSVYLWSKPCPMRKPPHNCLLCLLPGSAKGLCNPYTLWSRRGKAYSTLHAAFGRQPRYDGGSPI